MSTRDTTDIIMRELIALDPTFAEKEADARALVTLLTAEKPNVTIDEIFVRNLRARLLVPHTFPLRSPYHKVNWWAVHLAPIGALAILLLVLMPNTLHYFENETAIPVEISPTESLRMDANNDTSSRDAAPSAKLAPQSGGAQGDAVNSYSIMQESTNVSLPPPDRFELATQQPGIAISITSVTLTRPGYVVIHSFGPEGIGPVVGVSPLQNSGTTVGVPVYLRTVTHRGDEYYAALYYDNGNGVFNLTDDIPVINPNLGIPMGAEFTIGIPPTW